MRTLSFFITLLFISLSVNAQNRNFSAGVIPEFTLSHKLTDNFQFTGKIESKSNTWSSFSGHKSEWDYEYKGTNFQFFLVSSLHPLWKVAGGYQYHWSPEGKPNHRFMQQVSHVQLKIGYRIGHRLRSDQTVYESAKTKYRLRYRFSVEFPLQGESIEPGEFYFVSSDELLYEMIHERENSVENRFVVALGHNFNKNSKLEIGVDFRMDELFKSATRQKLWFTAGWYLNI